MDQWFVPEHQLALADQTVQNFVYDQRNQVEYKFNQLGFRSPEYSQDTSVVVVGNSISFGLGLAQEDTFGFKLSQQLGLQYNNFSFGGWLHENHDHLYNIQQLAKRDTDDIFVVQINNLDRCRIDSSTVKQGNDSSWCQKRFLDWFEQVTQALKHRNTYFLYWDTCDYDLPTSVQQQILINNKFHLDTSVPAHDMTFGLRSHHAVYQVLLSKLAKFSNRS